MTTLQRLVGHTHSAVFDRAPAAELAFRLRHPDGARWVVSERVLTVTAGSLEQVYNLSKFSVAGLAAQLTADGFDVIPGSGRVDNLSAMVLVEGDGDQFASNGDHLYGFTSLLWVIMSAHVGEVIDARVQMHEALRQMRITQAEGEWLDLWGALYAEGRRAGESDAAYAPRIPREAFRVRLNARAIEQAIKDRTGKDVFIEEPWGSMFRLDESALSGTNRFYNGESVGYHLIRPVSRQSIDWTDVLAVIERNRAAGVIVLSPESRLGSLVDASIAGVIWSGRLDRSGAYAPMSSDSRLDYLVLSGEEITRNWPVMLSELLTHGNTDGLADPYSLSLRRTVAKASIVLSDGAPLGDENAVLPRADLTQDGSAVRVSEDLELSSPDQLPVWKPVDVISTELHARGELDTGGPVAFSGVKPSVIIGRFVDATIDGTSSFVLSAGFTWREAGSWGEFPWSATQFEFARIESVTSRMDRYANNDLKDDLQQ